MDSGLSLMRTIFLYSTPMYLRTITAGARNLVSVIIKSSFVVFIGYKVAKHYSTNKIATVGKLKGLKNTANRIYSIISYWWVWFLYGMLLEIVVGEWTGRYFRIDTSKDNFSDTDTPKSEGRILTSNPSQVNIMSLEFSNILNFLVLLILAKFTFINSIYFQMETVDKLDFLSINDPYFQPIYLLFKSYIIITSIFFEKNIGYLVTSEWLYIFFLCTNLFIAAILHWVICKGMYFVKYET
jgi:hypothetical protein